MVSYGEDEAYAVGRFEVFGHNSATELLRDRVGRDETKPPRAALAHGHSSFVPPMHDEVGALGNICGSEQRLEVAISDGCPQSDFSNERRIPDDEIRLRPLRGAGLYITPDFDPRFLVGHRRSEEHTSELQSLMRNSYAVFFLKK